MKDDDVRDALEDAQHNIKTEPVDGGPNTTAVTAFFIDIRSDTLLKTRLSRQIMTPAVSILHCNLKTRRLLHNEK